MKHTLWLVALLLVACSAPQVRDELDASEISPGASVAMLPFNMQQQIEAEVYANAIKFAGTAGRLASFKGEETRQRRLRGILSGADYDIRDDLSQTALTELSTAGVRAERQAFRRSIDNVLGAVPPGRFEKRPPNTTGKDLVLDVYVDRWGYFAEGLSDDYLPTLHIGVRLLDGESLDELYRTRIEYHPLKPEEATVAIPADTAFSFPDTEAMTKEPQRTVDGLRAAVKAVVGQLVADLGGLSDR